VSKDEQIVALFVAMQLLGEEIKLESDLEGDLGISGDFAIELMEDYQKEFNVDLSNFAFSRYFSDEHGLLEDLLILIFRLRNESRTPLTIKHLVRGAISGRLDDKVIEENSLVTVGDDDLLANAASSGHTLEETDFKTLPRENQESLLMLFVAEHLLFCRKAEHSILNGTYVLTNCDMAAIAKYSRHFRVDLSNFHPEYYFSNPFKRSLSYIYGWLRGVKRPQKRKLQIQHLIKGAELGRLDDNLIRDI
jgi:hypothetical protein